MSWDYLFFVLEVRSLKSGSLAYRICFHLTVFSATSNRSAKSDHAKLLMGILYDACKQLRKEIASVLVLASQPVIQKSVQLPSLGFAERHTLVYQVSKSTNNSSHSSHAFPCTLSINVNLNLSCTHVPSPFQEMSLPSPVDINATSSPRRRSPVLHSLQ